MTRMQTMLNVLDSGLGVIGLARRRSNARYAATLVTTGAASALLGAALGVLLTPTGAPARARLKTGLDGVKHGLEGMKHGFEGVKNGLGGKSRQMATS